MEERGGGGGVAAGGEAELVSIPATPRVATPPFTPDILSTSHSRALTPSGQRSPRQMSSSLVSPAGGVKTPRTPWTPSSLISPRFLSPIGTPMKRVLINMKGYLEEVGHLTKLNPQDSWLPITESRNGNAHYSAFHNLNAGIGFQALLLPVAFAFLGWYVILQNVSLFRSGSYSRTHRKRGTGVGMWGRKRVVSCFSIINSNTHLTERDKLL